jgi:hypothetical protein
MMRIRVSDGLLFVEEKDGSRSVWQLISNSDYQLISGTYSTKGERNTYFDAKFPSQEALTPVQSQSGWDHQVATLARYEFNVPEWGISIRLQLGKGEPK